MKRTKAFPNEENEKVAKTVLLFDTEGEETNNTDGEIDYVLKDKKI